MRISRSSKRTAVGLATVLIAMTALACGRGSAFEGQGINAVGRENVTFVRVPSSPQALDAYATDSRLAGPVVVSCGPGQRALVRPILVRGEQVSQVECVSDPYGPATSAYGTYDRPAMVDVDPYGRVIPVHSEIRTVPVRTYPVRERRVVTERGSGRSWKKSAMVIGGSTAAGAGIGGLIGGKKGALIGAALGGGASTIFEATKR